MNEYNKKPENETNFIDNIDCPNEKYLLSNGTYSILKHESAGASLLTILINGFITAFYSGNEILLSFTLGAIAVMIFVIPFVLIYKYAGSSMYAHASLIVGLFINYFTYELIS